MRKETLYNTAQAAIDAIYGVDFTALEETLAALSIASESNPRVKQAADVLENALNELSEAITHLSGCKAELLSTAEHVITYTRPDGILVSTPASGVNLRHLASTLSTAYDFSDELTEWINDAVSVKDLIDRFNTAGKISGIQATAWINIDQ